MDKKGLGTSKRTISAALRRKHARERESTMEAILALSGELGYQQTTVRGVVERGGESRSQFYRHFGSLRECFALAHGAEADRLYLALVDVADRAPDCRAGLRAALAELFRFAAVRPQIARAIFCEVYVVGGVALSKHEELLERLSDAIDEGLRPGGGSPRHVPSPIAASFIVGGIESFLRSRLTLGEVEQLGQSLPELMHLAVGPYLGAKAAQEELGYRAPGLP